MPGLDGHQPAEPVAEHKDWPDPQRATGREQNDAKPANGISVEEPIVYDNLEGYARLTADLKTPVQIGENFYGPRALYAALQMKACDYVMPDFMRIGGVTGWQRAAAIAAAAGIPVSTHLYPEVAAHVMRVTETAHWLEWQDWANPVLQQPYEVKDGKLNIPDVPGAGLEWDEKAVAAHLADNF